ncbi:MAG: PEP-CTERM sorting domain-containing protein [Verrucomicrobia bacterium]|nr:PEP-CTERM sorting domain-containing protein [Verrucomicrobiota bacterium]
MSIRKLLVMSAGVLFFSHIALGAVIFNDTFEGAGVTVGKDFASDTAWSPISTAVLSVTNDSGNNALSVAMTANYRGTYSAFTPVTLASNETFTLSFKVRATSTPTNAANAFRVMFFNTALPTNATGLAFPANWGDSTGGGLTETKATSINGMDTGGLSFGSNPNMDLTGTGWHTVIASVTRLNDTHMSLTYSIDGVNTIINTNAADTTPPFTFDRVSFGSYQQQSFLLDDVQLMTSIPEPATMSLLVVSGMGLLLLRRIKRD